MSPEILPSKAPSEEQLTGQMLMLVLKTITNCMKGIKVWTGVWLIAEYLHNLHEALGSIPRGT
jgi:hypothetical protein